MTGIVIVQVKPSPKHDKPHETFEPPIWLLGTSLLIAFLLLCLLVHKLRNA